MVISFEQFLGTERQRPRIEPARPQGSTILIGSRECALLCVVATAVTTNLKFEFKTLQQSNARLLRSRTIVARLRQSCSIILRKKFKQTLQGLRILAITSRHNGPRLLLVTLLPANALVLSDPPTRPNTPCPFRTTS
jgi:hypothetical protein